MPGGGTLEHGTLPSDAELASGLVDFANLPAFTAREIQLLPECLDRCHEYRHECSRSTSAP